MISQVEYTGTGILVKVYEPFAWSNGENNNEENKENNVFACIL